MKNALTLLLLLLVSPGFVREARAGDELLAPDTELVTVRYDLRGLVPDDKGEQQWLQVLPFKLHHDWDEGDDTDEWEEEHELTNDVYELITGILAPDEFSQANREVEFEDRYTLVVTAPQAVHESARAALDMIRASMHRSVVLEVEEFQLRRLPSEAELADPDSLRESGAVAFRQLRSHEMTLGRTSVLRLESSHRVLRDWEPEIAEGAQASHPEFDDWSTGTVTMLRLEEDALGEGFRLRWLHRGSDVLKWESRETGAVASVYVDQTVITRPGDGVIDQPRLAVGSTLGSRRLGVGDEAVVATAIETADGPVGTVLRFRLQSVEPAPEPVRFALGQEYDEEDLPDEYGLLTMLDLSALYWLSMDVPRLDARMFWPTRFDGEFEYIEPVGFPAREWDGDSVDHVIDENLYEQSGPAWRWTHGGWNLLAGVPGSLERTTGRLALQAPRGRALTVDVRVEEQSRTGNASRVLGRVSLPLESSGAALALSGVTGLALIGYDVDVANSASGPDMISTGYFDGLSVEARGLGDDAVDLAITLHRLVSRERVDLLAGTAGSIDRLGFDRLEYRKRVVADGEEHRWGGASMGLAGSLGLELVISVRQR